MTRPYVYSEEGLIALVAVLIITAIAIGVSTSTALSGISEAQASLRYEHTRKALDLATACGEEGLLRLKNNFGYTLVSRETISLGGESCDIVSITGLGSQKEIKTEAVLEGARRRLEILASLRSGKLIIDSWQEVSDF